MMRRRSALLEFLRREDGATMVEYGLLLALIAVVVVVAVASVGRGAKQIYTQVAGTL